MACLSQILCSRSRLVSYLPGIHVLVNSLAGTRTLSAAGSLGFDESKMATTPSHIGLRSLLSDETMRSSGLLDRSSQLPGSVGLDCRLEGLEEQKTSVGMRMFPDTRPPSSDARHELQVSNKDSTTSSENVDPSEGYFNNSAVECAIQSCPQLLKKDFHSMFPDAPCCDVMVVTVTQRTQNDMTMWSAEVEQEREQMLDKFVGGAAEICRALQREGFWADFIEPSSGLAFFGTYTNNTLFETDDRYRHLGFQIEDLGCCRVIRHSLWGTHVFVGTIFTSAPPSSLTMKLQTTSQTHCRGCCFELSKHRPPALPAT
ncbi:metabolism of cobalamin associated Db [Melanotaenia boesemani]|uniref:metabolism of cobalamin associated Db n=1 Tax=Melanotaenia boesemani TaxID=1250792 RepID=UPI001C051411|nr:metabolism of cobalamin associated Db [Melanotaenia boesemani]XP_041857193.1 metabolism of cobalamin associated Db [Melanotaenia boesemani]